MFKSLSLVVVVCALFCANGCASFSMRREKSAQSENYNASFPDTWNAALRLIAEQGLKIVAVDKQARTMELTDGKNWLGSDKVRLQLQFQPVGAYQTKVVAVITVTRGTDGFMSDWSENFLSRLTSMVAFLKHDTHAPGQDPLSVPR